MEDPKSDDFYSALDALRDHIYRIELHEPLPETPHLRQEIRNAHPTSWRKPK